VSVLFRNLSCMVQNGVGNLEFDCGIFQMRCADAPFFCRIPCRTALLVLIFVYRFCVDTVLLFIYGAYVVSVSANICSCAFFYPTLLTWGCVLFVHLPWATNISPRCGDNLKSYFAINRLIDRFINCLLRLISLTRPDFCLLFL
jgi:hypothetical protein